MGATPESLHGHSGVSIRVAALGDRDAIIKVVRNAFSREDQDGREEVDIVLKTWSLQAVLDGLEMVAVEENAVVGYVLGARGDLDGRAVVAIAPLAVSTSHQRRGVGSALMRELIDRAEASGTRWSFFWVTLPTMVGLVLSLRALSAFHTLQSGSVTRTSRCVA